MDTNSQENQSSTAVAQLPQRNSTISTEKDKIVIKEEHVNDKNIPGSKETLQSIIKQFDPLGKSEKLDKTEEAGPSKRADEKLQLKGDNRSERLSETTLPNADARHNSVKSTTTQHDIPFDFNRFLEQMRHPSTQQIARYVKSFDQAFKRKPWAVNEQIRIFHDFLDFITVEMRKTELWQNVSEQEFENSKEGMEKLVMNRLYNLTFTPATRGPVTTDDRERDAILHQKIQIFRWVHETHLDIPITAHNDFFLSIAKAELLKINNYKAPRDKLICILNCCKVIFGLIKHVDGEGGADKFLPILIFVVLRADPPHLVSNVQYISRFRNSEKLQSEAGYYLSSLMGAIAFIENMELSSLSITEEEFDRNIEITVKELEKEQPRPEENDSVISYDNVVHPSKSVQGVRAPLNVQAKAFFEKGSNFAQRTIQRSINIMGKITQEFSTEPTEQANQSVSTGTLEVRSSSQSSSRNASPQRGPLINEASPLPLRNSSDNEMRGRQASLDTGKPRLRSASSSSLSSQASTDFSDMQTEAARISEAEYKRHVETLGSMFPNMADICGVVLQASECDLHTAIDKLLDMSDPKASTNPDRDVETVQNNDGYVTSTNQGTTGDQEKSGLLVDAS